MNLDNIFESLHDYEAKNWVHYTDTEMLTINPRPFHGDPIGIYCFPEDHFPKASMWHQKKYKFIITLKPNVNILDIKNIDDDLLYSLLSALNKTRSLF